MKSDKAEEGVEATNSSNSDPSSSIPNVVAEAAPTPVVSDVDARTKFSIGTVLPAQPLHTQPGITGVSPMAFNMMLPPPMIGN